MLAGMAEAKQFGAYRVLERLHAGGMATVFLAERGGERVALKIVHSKYGEDATFRRMLFEEARVASRVAHPNVVRLLEVGSHAGTAFLAMEYVDGADLAQVLDARSEPLPIDAAVAIAIAAAEGLHAAHEATDEDGSPLELVHRDVSPGNVMVARDGAIRLIDFGVARARGRAIKTSAGTLKGKFSYMSPEQVSGQELDRRTDVYALSIVLWECLTGRRYLDARHEVEILMLARHPRPSPPSALRAGVPAALDAAVLRGLAPRAAERFESAAAFRDALRGALPSARDVPATTVGALVPR